MASFIRTFKPTTTRPKFQNEISPNPIGFLKDNLRLQTILAVGAALQAALFAILPLRLAIAPATLYLLLRITRISLEAHNILPQTAYTADVIPGKVSGQLPPTTTTKPDTKDGTPAAHPVVVFMLGVRFNHPLGVLAPGGQQIQAHFQAMQADLQARADEYGLLGSSTWTANERDAANTIMILFYFRDVERLNKFAHDPVHRRGWDWFNREKHAHIGIMHEAFQVPAGAYESVYVNFSPTGLGGTAGLVRSEDGRQEWVRSLVKANKGVLRSQFGRMAKSSGVENEKYGEEIVWEGDGDAEAES